MIAGEDGLIAIDADLDHLVDNLTAMREVAKNKIKQLPLEARQNLWHDDNEPGVQLLPSKELPKVAGIVGNEGVIFGNDAGHEIPVGLSTQAEPVYVKAIVAIVLRNGHEGRVETFVDEEFHVDELDVVLMLSFRRDRRFSDLIVAATSESLRGRPRAGCAAAHISDSSTIRAVRDG